MTDRENERRLSTQRPADMFQGEPATPRLRPTDMFQGDGRTTPLEIPLVVALYEHPDFGGRVRVFVRDKPNLGTGWTKGAICQSGAVFDQITSSVGVHPGPDYESFKARNGGLEPTITLWSTHNFAYEGGYELELQTGAYPTLTN